MRFLKRFEHRLFDAAANALGKVIKAAEQSGDLDRFMVEFRREIRQRGNRGPAGPLRPVPGLDQKTAEGDGPVIMVWARGSTVPDEVWPTLVRDWED